MGLFIKLVTIIVTLIVLAMWTVIGFLLWIPFLTRMMVIFIGAVITSIYKRKDPTHAKMGLEAGITFYTRGFQTIFQSMGNNLNRSEFVTGNIEVRQVLLELLLAIVFWLGLLTAWQLSTHWGMARISEFTSPAFTSAVSAPVETSAGAQSLYTVDDSDKWKKWCGDWPTACKKTDPQIYAVWCKEANAGKDRFALDRVVCP